MNDDRGMRFRTLFDLAPIARLATDGEGTIYEANQAAVRLFGRSYEELIGLPVVRLVVPHDQPAVIAALERADDPHPAEVVVTLDRPAIPPTPGTPGTPGSSDQPPGEPELPPHRVALLAVTTRSPPSHAPDVQWIGRDVTTEEEATAALHRALASERAAAEGLRTVTEMRDIFLTAIAHDLRSPLAALLNLVEVLQQRRDLDATQRDELLDRIHQTATEMSTLVVDLLDLTRSEHGVMPLERSPADLAATVRHAVAQVLTANGRRLEVDLDLTPLTVDVDHRLAGRIVANLVTNARQHVPSGAQVWVRLGRRPEGALLTVEDDGPGIPDEVKPQVFELFRRGAGSSSLGIGLQLVRRFAELHGGWARVEDRPGGGASFKVLLPGSLDD